MKIAYLASRPYWHDNPSGGFAHMRQFLGNAADMGHDLILAHGGEHPHTAVRTAPKRGLARFLSLRGVDAMYYRIEHTAPRDIHLVLPPRRTLLGNPITVWEFNSVPEYALVQGEDAAAVERNLADLRRFGVCCDLAVCVSQAIADYVKEKIGLRHVMTVPNGTDPDLFTPAADPVRRVQRVAGRLNVLWMGSAELTWHDFDMLRDAAWMLWNDGQPTVAFHILGNGFPDLRDYPPNVHYHGPERYEKLPHWLAAMDVGLNVYRAGAADYSSPLKLFDYMGAGLTPVSTEQPQAREIFTKLDQPDLLVPKGDAQQLARVLRGLASDPARVRRQGQAARAMAVECYSWRRAVRDTLSAMVEVIRDRSRS